MKIVISVQQLMKHIIAGEKNQLEQIKKPYLRLNLNTAFTIYFLQLQQRLHMALS